jgi:hypothetical protein
VIEKLAHQNRKRVPERVHPDYAAGVREALAHTSKAGEKMETQKDLDRMALHDPK